MVKSMSVGKLLVLKERVSEENKCVVIYKTSNNYSIRVFSMFLRLWAESNLLHK